jgi:cytochrome c-type biogenesis protein CcmH
MLATAQRARAAPERPDPATALYKRQLAEVDVLAGRGLVDSAERETVRAEAGRRLLRAASAQGPSGDGAPPWSAPALALLAPLLATGLYFAFGAPGFPDRSHAQRLSEWRARPERLAPAEAAAVLTEIVRERPNDAEAHAQLARAQAAAGDAFGSAEAAETAARLQPDQALRWTELAQTLITLDPPQAAAATAALDRAQALAPGDPDLLYWRGRLAFAQEDQAGGRAAWNDLLGRLPPGDPRRQALITEIAALDGPVPQVDAAIEGMVSGLAERLRAEPLDPEGWTRLVRAYAVLGREAELRAATAEARRLFAGRPEVLRDLDTAIAEGRSRPALRGGG